MKPKRIQRRRTKGWRMPENTVSVTRPGKYGNPYVVGRTQGDAWGHEHDIKDAETAIKLFRYNLLNDVLLCNPDFLEPLRGKNLACFCPLDQPCHADVLLEIANSFIAIFKPISDDIAYSITVMNLSSVMS